MVTVFFCTGSVPCSEFVIQIFTRFGFPVYKINILESPASWVLVRITHVTVEGSTHTGSQMAAEPLMSFQQLPRMQQKMICIYLFKNMWIILHIWVTKVFFNYLLLSKHKSETSVTSEYEIYFSTPEYYSIHKDQPLYLFPGSRLEYC